MNRRDFLKMTALIPMLELSFESEFEKCAKDFTYCTQYLKIVHPLKGLIDWHSQQQDYLIRFTDHIQNNRFTIGKKFRCGGFTTHTLLWAFWKTIFTFEHNTVILCGRDRDAIYCKRIIDTVIRELPSFLQPKIGKNNDHEIHFPEIKSQMSFRTPGRQGKAIDLLVIDEPAFIENMDLHWKALYPCLSASINNKCIAVSTPKKSQGWFYDTYISSEKGENKFAVYRNSYLENKDYPWGKTTEQLKLDLGEKGFRQEILAEFLDDPYN